MTQLFCLAGTILPFLDICVDFAVFHRLLDVCHGSRSLTEMRLMLVFEYIDQDLAKYLERTALAGLGPDRIQVCKFISHVAFPP